MSVTGLPAKLLSSTALLCSHQRAGRRYARLKVSSELIGCWPATMASSRSVGRRARSIARRTRFGETSSRSAGAMVPLRSSSYQPKPRASAWIRLRSRLVGCCRSTRTSFSAAPRRFSFTGTVRIRAAPLGWIASVRPSRSSPGVPVHRVGLSRRRARPHPVVGCSSEHRVSPGPYLLGDAPRVLALQGVELGQPSRPTSPAPSDSRSERAVTTRFSISCCWMRHDGDALLAPSPLPDPGPSSSGRET